METLTLHLSIENLQIDPSTRTLVININGNQVAEASKTMKNNTARPSHRKKNSCLSVFMEDIIDTLYKEGKTRSAEAYQSTLNSFTDFMKHKDTYLYELKSPLMERYQAWLKKKGLTMNSISFYMRILRSAYNNAVGKDITPDNHPFKKVYTGIAKTAKRSITLDTMKEVLNFKSDDRRLTFARDMFLFSFYTRGMSFVDMSYLKKKDIVNGKLQYARKKTGQNITIEWTEELQSIVDRNPSANSVYLLPIIRKINGKERNQKRYIQNIVNDSLKKISEMLQLEDPLTMYVARHTWASLARNSGVPLKTISNAMGHESEKTTLIYLKNLDTTAVDRANRMIIDLINN